MKAVKIDYQFTDYLFYLRTKELSIRGYGFSFY